MPTIATRTDNICHCNNSQLYIDENCDAWLKREMVQNNCVSFDVFWEREHKCVYVRVSKKEREREFENECGRDNFILFILTFSRKSACR